MSDLPKMLVAIAVITLAGCQTVGSSSNGGFWSPGRPSFEVLSPDTPPAYPFANANAVSTKPKIAAISRMGHRPIPCNQPHCIMMIASKNFKAELFVTEEANVPNLIASTFSDFPADANEFDVESGDRATSSGRTFFFVIDNRGKTKQGYALAGFQGLVYAVRVKLRSGRLITHAFLREILEDIAVAER